MSYLDNIGFASRCRHSCKEIVGLANILAQAAPKQVARAIDFLSSLLSYAWPTWEHLPSVAFTVQTRSQPFKMSATLAL